MGVLDGQDVDAAVTNPAFINKNIDDVMPNKLGFTRALSGASIADVQAAVNKLYTASGASESTTGTAYNATPGTISNGDNYQLAFNKIAGKFDPATGHTHSGTAGDGPMIAFATQTSRGAVTLAGTANAPQDISGSSAPGTQNGIVPNANHVHRGVHSLSVTGGSPMYGDTYLIAGGGISISASTGGAFTIAVTGSSGANTSLSNLTTTSINESLIPNADVTFDLGSTTLHWEHLYVDVIEHSGGDLVLLTASSSGQGKDIGLTSSNGTGNTRGGGFIVATGTGQNSAPGAAFSVTGGTATSNGGSINAVAGASYNGGGGATLFVNGGVSSGNGGTAFFGSGAAYNGGTGASVSATGGNAHSGSGADGGFLTLSGGTSGNSNAGAVLFLQGGIYAGAAGYATLSAVNITLDSTGNLSVFGNLSVSTAGSGLTIKEGSNARSGLAVLVGGTVTVSNTSITASTRIQLTGNIDGGTPGWVRVSSRTNGTSFTITSSNPLDTSSIAWLLVEGT